MCSSSGVYSGYTHILTLNQCCHKPRDTDSGHSFHLGEAYNKNWSSWLQGTCNSLASYWTISKAAALFCLLTNVNGSYGQWCRLNTLLYTCFPASLLPILFLNQNHQWRTDSLVFSSAGFLGRPEVPVPQSVGTLWKNTLVGVL